MESLEQWSSPTVVHHVARHGQQKCQARAHSHLSKGLGGVKGQVNRRKYICIRESVEEVIYVSFDNGNKFTLQKENERLKQVFWLNKTSSR